MSINPVSYEYNGKAGTIDGKSSIGVLAQDLNKILPEMVSSFSITSSTGKVDIDKSSESDSEITEEFLSINTSSLQWVLVNAIKEQQTLIEDLQTQIADLRSTISSTENRAIDNVDLVDSEQSALGQNSPNPYNEGTVISYTVADSAISAKMNFYNLTGQLIKSVPLQSGAGQLNVSADELPSGTYTYSLEVDGALISNKKMVKMR